MADSGIQADAAPPDDSRAAWEAEWASEAVPSIESLRTLAERDAAARADAALAALLAIDLSCRRRRNLPVALDDYLARFPAREAVVRAAWERHAASLAESTTLPPRAAHEASTCDRPFDLDEPSDPYATRVPEATAASSATEGGRRVGPYEILSEIARGGMGVVYKARQIGVNRVVALKMILSGGFAGDHERRRFLAEAEAAGRLDHPHIVPVYHVGEHEGQPFFSMGFVDGASLKQLLADGPLPPRRAAELARTIAEAVHYAHTQGVVHRDIKPANVLIDSLGRPRVTDFGLAKQATTDSGMTATGEILGTPSYMPPEQAAGRTAEIGPLSDVYSLGALLYCLLTGRPPFQAATVTDTLIQVLERPPVPPQHLNAAVPGDLQLICLKCLEKRPEDRYPSATALADDLGRWLNGEAISVSSPRLVERLRRTLNHNRDDRELRAWGQILCAFALIVPIPELVEWVIFVFGFPAPYAWGIGVRVVELGVLGGILWSRRALWWPPQSPAARQMLSQWAAFVLACHLVVAVVTITHLASGADRPLGRFPSYPYFAILSGVLWFTLGSGFWGWCYAFGTAFFALSLLAPLTSDWAPLEFGALWGLFLWVTGRRLQRLAREGEPPLGESGASGMS